PLKVCPVRGRGSFSDDFGAPRYSGGFHLHQGNDMFAAFGTPIVAPFDGRSVQAPNKLGGLAVIVYGAQGYVYNAHLAAYGKLGEVKTGEVVGFVGNTGDAAGGPWHDHFEWHPAQVPARAHMSPYGVSDLEGAVDPFPYLMAACGCPASLLLTGWLDRARLLHTSPAQGHYSRGVAASGRALRAGAT